MRQGSIAIDATARLCENLPVLTVALTVCRKCLAKHNVDALPYVVRLVDAFLNRGSGSDSVVRGCNQGFSVHMLEYIAAHDVAPFWKEAAVNAAANGHVHVLQWLSNKHVGRCEWGANVMDTAARYGHLEAVQWLHDYRGKAAPPTPWTGQSAVAMWANRTEGCTDFALNYAAFGGHLEMLQWMSENRSEGRPGLALRAAAQNGHLPVVQWLYKRCSDRYHRLALEDAEKFKNSEVVNWPQQEISKRRGVRELLGGGVKWIWQLSLLSSSRT